MPGAAPPDNIIVFDGICHLCSRSVQFVLERDKRNRFRFAALQSGAGARLLRQYGLDPADARTFMLVKGGRAYVRSDAALEIAKDLPGFRALARLLSLVPRSIRDCVYSFVAGNRYRWFGKRDHCMMPTSEIRSKFLE